MKMKKIKIKYLYHSVCTCYRNDFHSRIEDCPNCTFLNELCKTCKGSRKWIKIVNCG